MARRPGTDHDPRKPNMLFANEQGSIAAQVASERHKVVRRALKTGQRRAQDRCLDTGQRCDTRQHGTELTGVLREVCGPRVQCPRRQVHRQRQPIAIEDQAARSTDRDLERACRHCLGRVTRTVNHL